MTPPRLQDYGLTPAWVREIEVRLARRRDALRAKSRRKGLGWILGLVGRFRPQVDQETKSTDTAGDAVYARAVEEYRRYTAYVTAVEEYERGYRQAQQAHEALQADYERSFKAWKIREVTRHKRYWLSLSGPAFERAVAALLRELGRSVRYLGGPNDQGIDLWVDGTVAVQCKQHGRPQGPRIVRELLGAKNAAKATKAVLVTTRGCTNKARAFAEKHGIEVWDVQKLMELREQAGDKQESVRPAQPPPFSLQPVPRKPVAPPPESGHLITRCPRCKRRNRVAWEWSDAAVRCGACHLEFKVT